MYSDSNFKFIEFRSSFKQFLLYFRYFRISIIYTEHDFKPPIIKVVVSLKSSHYTKQKLHVKNYHTIKRQEMLIYRLLYMKERNYFVMYSNDLSFV